MSSKPWLPTDHSGRITEKVFNQMKDETKRHEELDVTLKC